MRSSLALAIGGAVLWGGGKSKRNCHVGERTSRGACFVGAGASIPAGRGAMIKWIALLLIAVFASTQVQAQCPPADVNSDGQIRIDELIAVVRLALYGCPPAPCACCACDFGGGDVECGVGDLNCDVCISLGGSAAADCSVCSGQCGGGETLCINNPQHCVPPTPSCTCCACDFGNGDVECGTDTDCVECVALGGSPAADCSACGGLCSAGESLCMDNPQQCRTSSGAGAESGSKAGNIVRRSRAPYY